MCETEGVGAVGRGGARKMDGFLTAALDGLWRLKTVRNPVRKSFSGCQTSCVFSAGGMISGFFLIFIDASKSSGEGEDQSHAADRLSPLDGNPLTCQLLSAMGSRSQIM